MSVYHLCWDESNHMFYIFDRNDKSKIEDHDKIATTCVDGYSLFQYQIKVISSLPYEIATQSNT